MKVTEDTKRVAQATADFIMMNPENHNQGAFFKPGDLNQPWDSLPEDFSKDNLCGTTLCAAGAAVLVELGTEGVIDHLVEGSWADTAAGLLGLDPSETETLFYDIQDEPAALDALLAIANGDEQKFEYILETETTWARAERGLDN